MSDPYETIVVPISNVTDARQTAQAVREEFETATVVAVYVIEKAGGAPDTAGVEQRTEFADELFESFQEPLRETTLAVDYQLAYGTDIAGAILDVASESVAEAIVFVPRAGSRWQQLLSGDVARTLINQTDRPVLVLPNVGETDE